MLVSFVGVGRMREREGVTHPKEAGGRPPFSIASVRTNPPVTTDTRPKVFSINGRNASRKEHGQRERLLEIGNPTKTIRGLL